MFYQRHREKMIEGQLKRRGVKDLLVLEAMRKVPRHEFVPDESIDSAYQDCPLPIGCGQTISQPYMVAIMTESLGLQGGEKVLEVGTGSGYQAAVLAEIAGKVYSIERHATLALKAEKRLEKLGYKNVEILTGDGTLGLEEQGPFDGIIVTAGAPFVSENLKEQLVDGGRLLIPVGSHLMQSLLRITRRGDLFDQEDLMGCVFVPLLGKEGWKEM